MQVKYFIVLVVMILGCISTKSQVRDRNGNHILEQLITELINGGYINQDANLPINICDKALDLKYQVSNELMVDIGAFSPELFLKYIEKYPKPANISRNILLMLDNVSFENLDYKYGKMEKVKNLKIKAQIIYCEDRDNLNIWKHYLSNMVFSENKEYVFIVVTSVASSDPISTLYGLKLVDSKYSYQFGLSLII